MLASLKSEFRKLITTRSTYIILGFSTVMNLIFAFYIVGWHTSPEALSSPSYMASQVVSAINALGLFAALVGIMLMTHEYRYNTVTYTLTASRSRFKVLLSKYLVISAFALFFALLFGTLSPALSTLAIHLRGLTLAPQVFPVSSLLWRVTFASWGYVSLAFFLATIIRSQVGSIAAIFLIPSTVEQLLGLLLKQNQVYLPFSALNILLDMQGQGHISYARAALVVLGYLAVGWIVSLILFLRRDAN